VGRHWKVACHHFCTWRFIHGPDRRRKWQEQRSAKQQIMEGSGPFTYDLLTSQTDFREPGGVFAVKATLKFRPSNGLILCQHDLVVLQLTLVHWSIASTKSRSYAISSFRNIVSSGGPERSGSLFVPLFRYAREKQKLRLANGITREPGNDSCKA